MFPSGDSEEVFRSMSFQGPLQHFQVNILDCAGTRLFVPGALISSSFSPLQHFQVIILSSVGAYLLITRISKSRLWVGHSGRRWYMYIYPRDRHYPWPLSMLRGGHSMQLWNMSIYPKDIDGHLLAELKKDGSDHQHYKGITTWPSQGGESGQ